MVKMPLTEDVDTLKTKLLEAEEVKMQQQRELDQTHQRVRELERENVRLRNIEKDTQKLRDLEKSKREQAEEQLLDLKRRLVTLQTEHERQTHQLNHERTSVSEREKLMEDLATRDRVIEELCQRVYQVQQEVMDSRFKHLDETLAKIAAPVPSNVVNANNFRQEVTRDPVIAHPQLVEEQQNLIVRNDHEREGEKENEEDEDDEPGGCCSRRPVKKNKKKSKKSSGWCSCTSR